MCSPKTGSFVCHVREHVRWCLCSGEGSVGGAQEKNVSKTTWSTLLWNGNLRRRLQPEVGFGNFMQSQQTD